MHANSPIFLAKWAIWIEIEEIVLYYNILSGTKFRTWGIQTLCHDITFITVLFEMLEKKKKGRCFLGNEFFPQNIVYHCTNVPAQFFRKSKWGKRKKWESNTYSIILDIARSPSDTCQKDRRSKKRDFPITSCFWVVTWIQFLLLIWWHQVKQNDLGWLC